MSQERNAQQTVDDTRREFLRKSVYAAYATPIITALLVSNASAAASSTPQSSCASSGGKWIGSQGCCDTDRNGTCDWYP